MAHSVPDPFYTLTMARIYVNQGELAAAIRIYRHLMEKTPDDADLQAEMAAVQARMPKVPENWPRVADAVESWVRLLMYQDILLRFREFQPLSPDPFQCT